MPSIPVPSFVHDELQKDESIVWIGQPDTRLAMLSGVPIALIALIAFCILLTQVSLIQTTFSLHGLLSLLSSGLNLFFLIPLVALMCAPFGLMQKVRKVYYVITNKHILRFERSRRNKVERFDRDKATPLYQVSLLGKLSLVWSVPGSYRNNNGVTKPKTVGFFFIEPQALQMIGEAFPTSFAFSCRILLETRT